MMGKERRLTNDEQGMTSDDGKKKSDLEERLIDFAVRIIHLAIALPKSKIGNHICGQIIRSGTSPAPNYGEVQDAESRSDFIHKVKIISSSASVVRHSSLAIRQSLFDLKKIKVHCYTSAYL